MKRRIVENLISIATGAAPAVALMLAIAVPAAFAVDNPNCPPFYCESPEAEVAKQQKKQRALRSGLPPRLAEYFDRLPPCMACVDLSPDWPMITYTFDRDAWQAKHGRPPPFKSRSTPWSRDLESYARELMREGLITKFSIALADVPCRCCPSTATMETEIGYGADRKHYENTSGFDAELDVHAGAGEIFDDVSELGANPADLTEIPESFRRPDGLRLPPRELPPPVRVVQPSCPDCWPIADEYNDVGRQINELNKRLAKARQELSISAQALDGVWLELDGAGLLAGGAKQDALLEKLYQELSDRQNIYLEDKEEVQQLAQQLVELEQQLPRIMARLAECEEECKQLVNDGNIVIGGDGERSLFVPDGERPITGSCRQCTAEEQAHNEAAGALNAIRQRIIELAKRYSSDPDTRLETLAAHEQAIDEFADALENVVAARGALDDCERSCENGSIDDGTIGADSNPFTPINADESSGANEFWSDGAFGRACGQLGSVPADTIQCSVHTFKKPNAGEMQPTPDASLGNSVAVPESEGGGYDTEVFIRNPDDNNLRQGCGGMTPALLSQLFGYPPFNQATTRIVPIACNQIADEQGGGRGLIRNHRDQVNVDTSDRRKADYERTERQRNVRANPDDLSGVIQTTVLDAVADSPNRPQCTSARDPGPFELSDPKFEKLPGSIKELAQNTANAINGETTYDRVQAGFDALNAVDESLSNLGTRATRVKQANQVVKLTDQAADLIYRTQSGESVTIADFKNASEAIADLTGNAYVGKAGETFDVLLKLEELKLKQSQGIPVETKDIGELVDKLDTLRGDRFEALGEVLGGIKTNVDRIVKVEEVIKQLEKVSDFLDLAAEGQDDPVKAFEAFGEYLSMLSTIAEKVPGMGEFVAKYAEAVKSMQSDVETIAERVKATNEAIKMADEAIGGYDYDKLLADMEQFEQDLDEGADSGGQPSADEINLGRATYDAENAVDRARRCLRNNKRCIERNQARLAALRKQYEELREEYRSLPPQDQLEDELLEARMQEIYFEKFLDAKRANKAWMPTAEQARRMGSDSPTDAYFKLDNMSNNERSASNAVDRARHRANFRERAREQAKRMREEFARVKKELEDCRKRWVECEKEYWQALREYVAIHSYWSAFINNNNSSAAAAAARQEALASLDAQLVERGFAVTDGRVEFVVADECDEESTAVAVGGN